jgi:ELWxxDGT repeat protein
MPQQDSLETTGELLVAGFAGIVCISGQPRAPAGGFATAGQELWRTDGTFLGTSRVVDLNPGAAGSDPKNLVSFDGYVYFSAYTSLTGRELFRSRGTGEDASLVSVIDRGINPGRAAADPTDLTVKIILPQNCHNFTQKCTPGCCRPAGVLCSQSGFWTGDVACRTHHKQHDIEAAAAARHPSWTAEFEPEGFLFLGGAVPGVLLRLDPAGRRRALGEYRLPRWDKHASRHTARGSSQQPSVSDMVQGSAVLPCRRWCTRP